MSEYILEFDELKEYLDQKEPFVFVDRVIELEKKKSIKVLKNISGNDPWFIGHFPGRAVMPGAILLEAVAQSAMLLVRLSYKGKKNELGVFSSVRGKFLKPIYPGDQILIIVEIMKSIEKGCVFDSKVEVNGNVCATANMVCGFIEK